MKYDDFCLSENFEKMAAEYHKTLQEHGFVFVRLDQSSSKNLAKNALEQLAILNGVLTFASRYAFGRNPMLQNLKNLTEIQKQSLCSMYGLAATQHPTMSTANFERVIGAEAAVLKALFDLFEHEDDQEKRLLVKNMIVLRLDALSAKMATKY